MLKKFLPFIQALVAAVLFGASAPLAKILLGSLDPIPLAGLLYLGSGIMGLAMLMGQKRFGGSTSSEAPLSRQDLPWLAGAVIAGGILAPIILMTSLQSTPATTASLLLNFECIATTLIAALAFKEAIGKRITFAIVLITIASMMLSWEGGSAWGFSLGALGILAACTLWGVDNNFTRKISIKNPLVIVTIKGISAGCFSILLGVFLHKPFPGFGAAILAMILGAFSYGLSIYLFIHAMRSLGAARTSALFGSAPFVGAAISVILLHETPVPLFAFALVFMLAGTWLMLSEDHNHVHAHLPLQHEHSHSHPGDVHHQHDHSFPISSQPSTHSHPHVHDALTHQHAHAPDIHHTHSHPST